jgi:coenzyme F420-reducing hydrogenase beta subunit
MLVLAQSFICTKNLAFIAIIGCIYEMSLKQAGNTQGNREREEKKLEEQFLKGTKDEYLGIHCDLFSAKTNVKGQDGGVVSALLVKSFQEGLFDAAIVVRRMNGYSAEAVVVENADDVLLARGTKYLKVNVTKKLTELINQGIRQIAIVCTPCENAAIRRIQQRIGKNCEITVIGLFCLESFNREKLIDQVRVRLGVDLDLAEKTQVRQGKFIVTIDDRDISCRVKDLDCAVEETCNFCGDFTSRLADISVGSVGSKKGYSTVIVRSSRGEKLVRNLKAERLLVNKEEIAKLSKFKKKRAQENLAKLNSH